MEKYFPSPSFSFFAICHTRLVVFVDDLRVNMKCRFLFIKGKMLFNSTWIPLPEKLTVICIFNY